MNNFDWETEEEERLSQHLSESTATHRRGRIVIVVAILIILLVAAAAVTLRLKDQAEIQANRVEVDIISAYRIWKEAVSQSDRELLNSIIVGEDPRWTTTQRQLIETGLIFERQGFGLDAISPHSLPENPVYELHDNWRRADIFFTQEYKAETESIGADLIELTHTVGFRREGSRWLYSQTADTFWGESQILDYENLTVTFPERDRGSVMKLAKDLNLDLEQICQRILMTSCPPDSHIEMIFDVDASILLKISDPELPVFQGKAFILPTPTILGKPTDDHSYQTVYEAYFNPIAAVFKAGLSSPIPLPDQTVHLLCYSEFGARPRLFSYDAGNDLWSVTMPERSFQFLSALADDEGLLLQEYPADSGANYLSLVSLSANDSQHLFDYGMSAIQAFPAGKYTFINRPDILMKTINTRQENVRFNMIDGSQCEDDGCQTIELDGFPVWSPNGKNTLLWQAGMIFLGDSKGAAHTELAEGFTPFWIDDQYFGFAKFTEINSHSEVVLFYANIEDKQLHPLITSTQLSESTSLPSSKSIFIRLATPRPGAPNELVILAREYGGENSRYLLRAKILVQSSGLSISQVEELALIKGIPGSYPSAQTPTRKIPFVFSSDGNQIAIGRKADSEIHYWDIQIIGIDDGSQKIYRTNYPAYTFLHPYIDWSLDGQWLAIIGDGFLQLISPEYEYRRIIAHDMHACSHVAWVNK